MNLQVRVLTTDAYGGQGRIALYNRDIAQALVKMPKVGVVAAPRHQPLLADGIPMKVRWLYTYILQLSIRFPLATPNEPKRQ